jgi:hypothetical protein
MRILVVAPPKTGNVWLEKLFSAAFDFDWIRSAPPYDHWNRGDPSALEDFIAAGSYPERSICHQHYWPSSRLFELTERYDIRLSTTLRDPYDQFVSWYFYVQNFPEWFVAAADPAQRPIGKPINDPDVLDFLERYFGSFLDLGIEWIESGKSLIVRYESLHSDPEGVLTAAQGRLGLEPARPFPEAIAAASAESMRRMGPDLQRHIRSGTVNNSRELLSEAHLEIFRRVHADRVTRLGYAVR